MAAKKTIAQPMRAPDIKPYTHFPVEGEVRLPEWMVELREDLYKENHSE